MCSILQTIFGCRPTENHLDLQSAFGKLSGALDHAARDLSCRCDRTKIAPCDWTDIYKCHDGKTCKIREQCSKWSLVKAMKSVLTFGLLSLFIDSGPNPVIRPPQYDIGQHLEVAFAENPSTLPWSASKVVDDILRLVYWRGSGTIAASCGPSTIYPSILTTLQMPSHQFVTFSLVEGLFVYEQRYHTCLRAEGSRARPKQRKARGMGDMVPSHTGVHSGRALLTIREAFHCLELHCSVQYAGFETRVNLKHVLSGYVGLQWPGMCSHPFDTPLNLGKYTASATNVAAPKACRGMGVAMTRRNPTAQFLCCEFLVPAILQRECCLNCAAEALGWPDGVIIVG